MGRRQPRSPRRPPPQTTFLFKGFDEVRRLGLRPETEAEVRAAATRCHGAPETQAWARASASPEPAAPQQQIGRAHV